ncbi:hypothetical protein BpHYR1_025839 [Brachionus plicatilis]|uniref:Uncharacterized protein n=1 Tax=Brachionus plicatilis TaxID=10195 RepID=A0A3M7P209_BRAPC|nr:hypothetical protein BpHYR1_025839 [Brachionus plicatilis]
MLDIDQLQNPLHHLCPPTSRIRRCRLVTTTNNSERLVKLNLTSLEERRTRGDLIQFYKCYTGTNIVNWH